MAIRGVIPKSKSEQFDAFKKLQDLADAADVVVAIPDAPDDGKTYARSGEAWAEILGITDTAALTAARAAPAAYSVDPADIAAVLVALGVMEADGA